MSLLSSPPRAGSARQRWPRLIPPLADPAGPRIAGIGGEIKTHPPDGGLYTFGR